MVDRFGVCLKSPFEVLCTIKLSVARGLIAGSSSFFLGLVGKGCLIWISDAESLLFIVEGIDTC